MTRKEIKTKIEELRNKSLEIENKARTHIERFVHEVCGSEFYVPYFYPAHFAVRHADQELNAFEVHIEDLSLDYSKSTMKVSMAGKGAFEPCKGLPVEKEYAAFGEFLKNAWQIKDLFLGCYKECSKIASEYRELKDELPTRPDFTYFEGEKTEWIYVDGCGSIELELPEVIAKYCYHSGACDADVETALDIPGIRAQFDKISDELLIESLKECGIDEYDPVTATRRENETWALWMACGNAAEEGIFD